MTCPGSHSLLWGRSSPTHERETMQVETKQRMCHLELESEIPY